MVCCPSSDTRPDRKADCIKPERWVQDQGRGHETAPGNHAETILGEKMKSWRIIDSKDKYVGGVTRYNNPSIKDEILLKTQKGKFIHGKIIWQKQKDYR